MKNFILNPGRLATITVVSILLVSLQASLFGIVQSYTQDYEGECSFAFWSKNERSIILNLKCGTKTVYNEDKDVMLKYLAKPGPLTCKTYKSGSAICQMLK